MEATSTPAASTNTAAPEDPVTKQAARDEAVAKADQARADAQKSLIEAQNAARTAKYPVPKSERLEGKAEIDAKVGLVADLIAHSLIDDGVSAISAEIIPKLGDKPHRILLIEDRELIASDWVYQVVRARLKAFTSALTSAGLEIDLGLGAAPKEKPLVEKEMELAELDTALGASALMGSGFGPGIAGASSLVGGVADLVGWLRADYSIKARDVTIGQTPLLAALAHHLLGDERSVDVDAFGVLEDSPIIRDFVALLEERNEIKARVAELKSSVVEPNGRNRDERIAALKEVTTRIAEALKAKKGEAQQDLLVSREKELRKQISALEAAGGKTSATVNAVEAILTSSGEFVTDVIAAPDEDKTYPPLLSAALRERLHDGDRNFTHVLYASVESQGGESITKRWLFTSPRVRYVGGAQLSYLLLDVNKNTITAAGNHPVLGHAKFSLWRGAVDPVATVDLSQRVTNGVFLGWWRGLRLHSAP